MRKRIKVRPLFHTLTQRQFVDLLLTPTIDTYYKANIWKSATLTKMTATVPFKTRQRKISDGLFDTLVDELSAWVDPSAQINGLRTTVFEPAIKLHQSITCSRQIYELANPVNLPQKRLTTGQEEWTLKSITNWKVVDADDDIVPFQCLFPGLSRISTSEGEIDKLELLKPVVIVRRHSDQRQSRPRTRTSAEIRGAETIARAAVPLPRSHSSSARQYESKKSGGFLKEMFRNKPSATTSQPPPPPAGSSPRRSTEDVHHRPRAHRRRNSRQRYSQGKEWPSDPSFSEVGTSFARHKSASPRTSYTNK